jgi:hypothetical protein
MEDNLKTIKKWKKASKKNGRQPQKKWKTTSTKIKTENDLKK